MGASFHRACAATHAVFAIFFCLGLATGEDLRPWAAGCCILAVVHLLRAAGLRRMPR